MPRKYAHQWEIDGPTIDVFPEETPVRCKRCGRRAISCDDPYMDTTRFECIEESVNIPPPPTNDPI